MTTPFKTAAKVGMASALALSTALTAVPALAQQPQYPAQDYQRDTQYAPAPGPQYQPTPRYQQQQQQYQQDYQDYQARKDAYDARRDAYEARRSNYEANRADYQMARRDYERRRAAWERARANYDARYGYGAYIRIYGPAPVWDTDRWGPYDGPGYADRYGRPSAYVAPEPVTCRNDHSGATAGAILGAIAGAALGSNLSAPGRHTENSVLGGVIGGGLGAAVGNAHDRYKCDNRGPYYSYSDTIAYREDPRFRSGRYDYAYYQRMRCRLAAAPVDYDGRDYRYVRVCPDADGRYRITG
ncbi:MAG: glycine zipper 2TM domain-containing protein [Proteobacteria bacterium]|nr:glycine zipper 2TM domain-containing protein [Pseudomonadota bacterium]